MNKVIASLIAFNLLLRCLIPALSFDHGPIDYGAALRVAASHSILTNFFYNSTLPITIVSRLAADALHDLSSSGRQSRPLPDPRRNQQTDTSAAMALSAAGDPHSMVRNASRSCPRTADRCYCDLLYGPRSPDAAVARASAAGTILFICIIAVFFFLLPRSSIPADAIISRSILSLMDPIRQMPDRVFCSPLCRRKHRGRFDTSMRGAHRANDNDLWPGKRPERRLQ